MWEKQRGMIFLSIIDLLSLLVRLSLLKYLHKEIHVHVYPAYHIECLAFKLDQTLSNERVWCSSAIQQNPLTKKNWIDHLIFEVSQTLSWVIEQSGTHIRNTRMEQNQTFQFQAIDGKCVNYWSSVKAVKAM